MPSKIAFALAPFLMAIQFSGGTAASANATATDGSTQLASSAQLAAVSAAIPPTCTTAPYPDTYGGNLGTLAPCVHPQDAARPTQVQTPTTAITTASDGSFSGSWKVAFSNVPSTVISQVNNTGQPYICQAAGTMTGFSGKCWQVVPTTLPNTVTSITGLVLSPVANPAAGLPVSVVGRQ